MLYSCIFSGVTIIYFWRKKVSESVLSRLLNEPHTRWWSSVSCCANPLNSSFIVIVSNSFLDSTFLSSRDYHTWFSPPDYLLGGNWSSSISATLSWEWSPRLSPSDIFVHLFYSQSDHVLSLISNTRCEGPVEVTLANPQW